MHGERNKNEGREGKGLLIMIKRETKMLIVHVAKKACKL